MQLVWLLPMVQLEPVEAPFLYSVTEYDEVAPIAEAKLNAALEIVPAAGVVLQLPAVWLVQLAETDVYQFPVLQDPPAVAVALPLPV